MTQFAIVEFVLEKAVDVVPETWIETRDGVSFFCCIFFRPVYLENAK